MSGPIRDALKKEGRALKREFRRQLGGFGRDAGRQVSGLADELVRQLLGNSKRRGRGKRR